ncbi:hypothetical protein [Microbaculum marinisediminis]|uniref:Uncharacterized protein n=1 Tax=Microbaculum marinisediminis TaxID=2931392 RepID=A0AAW5QVS9_9HYPH|nr:hypothetical protein [Microbaculum sp. A6E488]MCT8970606.1 hypothetical protein [Microbaculum sp. A6E488]
MLTPEKLYAAAREKAVTRRAEALQLRARQREEIARAATGGGGGPGGAGPGGVGLADGYWERRDRAEREADAYAALADVFGALIGEATGADVANGGGAPLPTGRLRDVRDLVGALGGRKAAERFYGATRQRLGGWISRGQIPAEWADMTRAALPGYDISGAVFGMVRVRRGAAGEAAE